MKNFTTLTEKDETLAQLEPADKKLSNTTEDMSLADRVKRRRRRVS